MDKSMLSKAFLKLVQELPRHKASLLFQLRSGHVPLQAHLHRIKRAESPMCAHCPGSRETVHHFVLLCPAFAEQRLELVQQGGRDARVLAKLLSSTKLVPLLLQFVKKEDQALPQRHQRGHVSVK